MFKKLTLAGAAPAMGTAPWPRPKPPRSVMATATARLLRQQRLSRLSRQRSPTIAAPTATIAGPIATTSCSSGTTGTIPGAVAGGLPGRAIDTRGDLPLARTLLGGAAALAGRAVEKSDNPRYCR